MICDECETVAHCMKNGCVPKTTKKNEVLRLALEALEKIGMRGWVERKEEAITALREALNASLAEQPAPPPECQTEAEKTAFAFGWFKALESVRQQPARLDLPDFIAGALGVSRGAAYDMMREALKEKNSD